MQAHVNDIMKNWPPASGKGKYHEIAKNISTVNAQRASYIFELLFAYELECAGLELQYEVNINNSGKTVDFVYETDGKKLSFELVSPDENDVVKKLSKPDANGFYGSVRASNDTGCGTSGKPSTSKESEHFRPEADTIRAQEKLLDKVDKFPEPADDLFSLIVMNCHRLKSGIFDPDDARMICFGAAKEPVNQEDWKNGRIKGIFENDHPLAKAKEFRRKVSAVIFVPKLKKSMLMNRILVGNPAREKHVLDLKHILFKAGFMPYNLAASSA